MEQNELEAALINLDYSLGVIKTVVGNLTANSSLDDINRASALVDLAHKYAHSATEDLINE